ncbi:MAG: HAMP domain-containing histidine kinase [Flavobacteriales bacterium]|nr:HAMP domain-containing histidine kinase [Flavobacteriales bacterium]
MKLLHRTRRPFWIYAAVVMVLSVPAYYLVLERQWLADIDEDLTVQKEKLEHGLNARRLSDVELDSAVVRLNALDIGVQLAQGERSMPDHYATVTRPDAFHGHDEPFRTYTSTIHVNGRTYAITVSRVIEETEELITGIALIATITLLLLFGGVLLLDRMSAQRIWAPFHSMLARLKRFQVDDAEPFRAAATGVNEFDELEREMEQLTARNMAMYVEQRRFTENAAHELRTPIALLQGKLERLFQSKDLTQEQATLLEEASTVLGRMHRSHEGLLLLARLENGTAPRSGTSDPYAIVRIALEQADDRIRELGLSVSVERVPDMTWRLDPAMAEILLVNLVGNAIRHNVPGGRIDVRITPSSFAIANTGAEAGLDPAHLFKRFAGSGKGLGLGLAIAQRVCERQGCTLNYAFEAPLHVFRVTLRG